MKTLKKTAVFAFLEHITQNFFRVAVSCATSAKSFRNFNPKILAFKRVLDLTSSISEPEGASNSVQRLLNFSKLLQLFTVYDFKNVRKVIEMVLTSLCYCRKITKITQRLGALPTGSLCDTLELH